MSTTYKIKELFIYPIKSLAGISCQQLSAREMGFENDRRWMLIDANNEFITQREHPIMSQFYPQISSNEIEISFQDKKHSFLLSECFGTAIRSNVWDDESIVFEVNKETSKWFSAQLGFECKLVKILNSGDRKHSSSKLNQTLNVSLADGYPYLLVGSESLNHLNDKLSEKITIQRFRPNIVVDTVIAHEEDAFDTFQIGEVKFKNAKPCGRCIMVNTNPKTGIVHKEPLKTLSRYRNVDNLVYFGTNIICLNEGVIVVGDVLSF